MSDDDLVFWQSILAPLAGIIVTLVLAWRTRRFLARAARAPGTIARVTAEETKQWQGEGRGSEIVTTYVAHVEFQPAGGPRVEFRSASLNDRPGVGQAVTVAYDQARPEATAKIDDGVVWRPTVIAAGVTFLLVLYSLWTFVHRMGEA